MRLEEQIINFLNFLYLFGCNNVRSTLEQINKIKFVLKLIILDRLEFGNLTGRREETYFKESP